MYRWIAVLVTVLVLGSSAPAHALQMSPFDADVHELPGWDDVAECMTLRTDWLEECTSALNLDGKQASARQNFDAAIKRFNQVIRLEKAAYVYNNRGVAYLKKGDLLRARRDLERALTYDPNYASAWDALARVHLRKKRYEVALTHINHAIKLTPDNAYLFEIRSEIYAGLKREKLSRSDAQRAAAMHEENAVSEYAW